MNKAKSISAFGTFFMLLLCGTNSFGQGNSDTAVVSKAYVLQVVFVEFEAYSSESGNIIEWSTILEANLDRYEIQRSTDNQPFEKIGEIKAKGVSSSVTQYYTFTDKNPVAGKNIYRLKMIDTRNGSKLSANKSVSSNGHILFNTDFHTYPNPAKPGSSIHVYVKEKGAYTLQLFNLTGKMVYVTQATGGGSAGFSVQLPTQMGRGFYVLRLTQPGMAQIQQQKILVQ